MDASNPVITGERTTFAQLQQDNLLLKRQDLGKLKLELASEPRTPAPFVNREARDVDPRELKRLTTVEQPPKSVLDMSWAAARPPIRVSSYHTQGVNQADGNVSLTLAFSTASRLPQVVSAILREVPDAEEDVTRLVFSRGTRAGFEKRIKLWYTNNVPNPATNLQQKWNIVPSEVIAKRFPFNPKLLTDWNGEMKPQLARVSVNKQSSTGPPFFRPKFQALDDCMDLLEDILQKSAFPEDLSVFLANNPELLAAQCKNKLDRYKTEELQEKTRPYFSFCFPIQLLFSRLSQEFTHACYLFTEKHASANAYGFSWAHGGGAKMRRWMMSTEEGQVKFCVYGDDVRLVWRKQGNLYVNSPDFRSMDGSVHKNHAKWAVEYILGAYKRAFGDSPFWEYIGQLWISQLVGAPFWVEGEKVYQNPDSGLMTGCVGTTFVDTVTAVLAYETLVEAATLGQVDIGQEDQVAKFFKALGLNLKAGTYEWAFVDEETREGMFVEQEWLGVSLYFAEGLKETEPIPWKKEEDLVALIANARFVRDSQEKSSATVLARYLFDMARGYMITGAFQHKNVWNVCCDLIDRTSSEVIAMRVQTGKSDDDGERVGEGPELSNMVDEDFSWPSSDGWPNLSFCVNVFLSHDNKRKDATWHFAFPGLVARIKEMRRGREYMDAVKRANENHPTSLSDPWTEHAVELKCDGKRQPSVFLPERTPLARLAMKLPTKVPAALIQFKKKPETIQSKEKRILELIPPDVEGFHREMLTLLTGYSRPFVTRVVYALKTAKGESFRPGKDGYWSIHHETPSGNWLDYELDPSLLDRAPAPPPEQEPATPQTKAEEYFYLPPAVLPPPKPLGDSVSYVSAAFVCAGSVLEWTFTELAKSPNSRVRATSYLREDREIIISVTESSNGKKAKGDACEVLRRKIESRANQSKTEDQVATTSRENDIESSKKRAPAASQTAKERGEDEDDGDSDDEPEFTTDALSDLEEEKE